MDMTALKTALADIIGILRTLLSNHATTADRLTAIETAMKDAAQLPAAFAELQTEINTLKTMITPPAPPAQ